MDVKKTEEYDKEMMKLLRNIESEIRGEYGGDVLSWVKHKLDKYIVGEDNNKILLWLIMVSKDMDNPLHASIEGPSSVGKTTLVERVSKALPPDSIEELSRFTPAFLDYIKDRLKHKVLWVQQLSSESSYDALHVMMTEKGLRLGTVKRVEGGTWEPYFVEAEGPISFVTTTIHSTRLDEQFRTRVWRIYPDDSPEQTIKIQEFNARIAREPWLLEEAEEELKKISLYVKYLQEYGIKKVLIPYADKLVIKGKGIRLRRDQLKLLELVKVIAYVNQFYNHYIIVINGEPYIVASKQDLEKAMEISGESLKKTIMDLSRGEEELLRIAIKLTEEGEDITARNVAKKSNGKYSQSTCRKYLNHLVDLGYLYIVEGTGGPGRQNIYQLADYTDLPSVIDLNEIEEPNDIYEYLRKHYDIHAEDIYFYYDIYTLESYTTHKHFFLSHFPNSETLDKIRQKTGISNNIRESHLMPNNIESFGNGKMGWEKKSEIDYVNVAFAFVKDKMMNQLPLDEDDLKVAYQVDKEMLRKYLEDKILDGMVLSTDEMLFLMEYYPDLYELYSGRMGGDV